MPVNTGPDINTYGIPEVSLSNTFNAWRDISNISAYKLNKLKIYEGLSTASIDTTTTVAGVLQPVLLPTVLSGHTFAGGIAGTTATFSGLLRANSGISCAGGMTVSGDLAVGGGDITTSSTTASLFNTNVTNLSIGGAATGITIGSSSANSVTTIQSATTYFSGNLVIGGTATSINTNNLFIEDTVITLGVCGGVGVTTDVSRDRGVEFYWYDNSFGQYATLGFFGFDRSTQNFIFYSNGVTSPNGIYSGVTGTFQGNFLGGGITATNLYVSSLGTFVGGITSSGVTATNLYVSSLGTFVGGITTSGVTATNLYVSSLGTFLGGITSSGVTATNLYVSSLGTFLGGITTSGVTATTLNVNSLAKFGGGATFAGGGVTLGSTSPLNVLGVSNYTGLGTFVGGITSSGVTATTLNVGSLATFVGGITTSGVTATTLNVSSLAKFGGGATFAGGGVTLESTSPLAIKSSIKFLSGSNANSVGFGAPANPSSSVTWILPSASATANGQVLSSDTSNNLTWSSITLTPPSGGIGSAGNNQIQYSNGTGFSGDAGLLYSGVGGLTLSKNLTVTALARFGGGATFAGGGVTLDSTSPLNVLGVSNYTGLGTFVGGITSSGVTATNLYVSSLGTFVGGITTSGVTATTLNVNSLGTFLGGITSSGVTATNLYVSSLGTFLGGITTSGVTATTLNVSSLSKFGGGATFAGGGVTLGSTSPLNVLGVSNYTGLGTFVGGITSSGVTATNLYVSSLGTFVGGITTSGVTATNLNVLNTTTLKDLFVSGNLTFGGTAATINVQSTNVNVADTIMVLGSSGGIGITGDTTNDRGIAFFWNENASAGSCLGFFGFDRTTQNFVFYTSGATTGTGSSGGVTGTFEGNFLGATAAFTDVRFHDDDRSHSVGFRAPSTVSSNITWILPGVTGAAGTVIGTDANQNLSWILPAVVAGSDKQVMFNDAGSLAGNAGFVYNKTTFTIGVSAGIGFGTGWGATLSVDTTGLSGGVSISTKGSTAMYWGATGSVGLVGIGGSTASTPAIVPASTGRLEVNGDIRVAKNGFFVNPNMIITGNCVIGADENAIFAGALTIASGQTLSVGSGGSLIIL